MYGGQGQGQGYGQFNGYGTPPGPSGGRPNSSAASPSAAALDKGGSADDHGGWQPSQTYDEGTPQSYGQGQRHDGQPFGTQIPKTSSLESFTRPDVAAQGVAAAAVAMFAGDSSAAQRLIEQQGRAAAAAYIPGAAAGWSRARCYFAVSHASVAAKLRAVLAPWTKRHWRRKRRRTSSTSRATATRCLCTILMPLIYTCRW